MLGKDENDSYLKPGMKDETEKRGYAQPVKPKYSKGVAPLKKGYKPKNTTMPLQKGSTQPNKKKAALSSMLGSLSSGAGFKN